MARYTRYRKYSRRYRRKGIWSSRLQEFRGEQLASGQNDFIIYNNLCKNPDQSDSTVSQKYTVKNIDLTIQLESEAPLAVNRLQFYVMFVPQGYVPTGVPSAYGSLPYEHPEWIMAHKFYGSPTNSGDPGFAPLRVKTRLSRKLDTGDRIICLILGTNTDTNSHTLYYDGLCKYNTKAN